MEIEQDHERMIYTRGRWFPSDESMRASLSAGNSDDCPIIGSNTSLTLKKGLVDAIVGLGGGVTNYCWRWCRIEDCPTYIAEHRLKI